MKLKVTISIIVRVIGKNDVLHGEFLLSCPALLLIRLLRVSLKLQSDFIDAGRRQIRFLKNLPSFYLAMTSQFPEYQTFVNCFLNN